MEGSHNQNDQGLRRSPRKKTTQSQSMQLPAFQQDSVVSKSVTTKKNGSSAQVRSRLLKQTKSSCGTSKPSTGLREIDLPYTSDVDELQTAISSAQKSRPSRKRSEIDAVVSSLDLLSLAQRSGNVDTDSRKCVPKSKAKPAKHYTSRFVLKEANCVDDYSDAGEDDDEDTDLSGFIVDDDAELSYHGTDEDSENDHKATPPARPRRRLQRGRRRVIDSESDKENDSQSELANALKNLRVGTERRTNPRGSPQELIDLTASSPVTSKAESFRPNHVDEEPFSGHSGSPRDNDTRQSSDLPSLFDSLLRLSPPKSSKPSVDAAQSNVSRERSMKGNAKTVDVLERPRTPTRARTPPQLKSPSKLLSPSKRQDNKRSPHRQSTDAFWDLHTINDWVDVNSPKKAPVDSPQKNPLAKFAIWSDDDDMAGYSSSNSSNPSPCVSPTKRLTSPEKKARAAHFAEKKRKKAARDAFDAIKEDLAQDLIIYLDNNVTEGKLNRMSAPTGGVGIIWSKTLRTTAGRANYSRKTEISIAPSPPVSRRGSSSSELIDLTGDLVRISPTKKKVRHHANIELAAKVIDREDRLVNTVSHEFCHLADYMISDVLKDPHGASFFAWSKKVIACLQRTITGDPRATISATPTTNNNTVQTQDLVLGIRPSWQHCAITTKHNYEIDWKYLWVCVGKAELSTQGCGSEHGRHSKSLDPEIMRCGKCRGRLEQVRPKPRKASPMKKNNNNMNTLLDSPRKNLSRTSSSSSDNDSQKNPSSSSGSIAGKLGAMVDVIELSD